ncbi:hypothetical protein ACIA8C_07135 [Nocardia sp. NPDC051321]|uniref:hypothetical protein n=1 Tax=Nocardia sp. NPDC051321 TaxID=3364323 RepID=UPI0037ABC7D8
MSELEIPRDEREAVIRALYRQVEDLDWESMPPGRKSEQYALWIEDYEIGGRLADWYTTDGIRVWLKDGPLKEYGRALEGVGAYAEFVTKRYPSPERMLQDALGAEWTIVANSIAEKPMHCSATNGSETRYVCWGKPTTFRDLLWAAVSAAIDLPARPMIIVTTRAGRTVDEGLRIKQSKIAEHCRVDLRYAERHLIFVRSASCRLPTT